MSGMRYMKLDLRAPIEGAAIPCDSFFSSPVRGERFARFELQADQLRDIDTPAGYFLGPVLQAALVDTVAERVSLDAGLYWFAQMKVNGDRIDRAMADELALELHKEGLWQGIPMGATVWVRALPEGEETVVQILRAMTA